MPDPNAPDKHRVARAFAAAADTYDSHAALQRTVADRLLERLDLFRLSPARILDAGAGTGYAARALERCYRGARVLLADIAAPMLARAREQRPFFSRQRYVCADTERLPLADGWSDFVFSSLMLQWSADPDRVFAEWRRVLAPGGLLLFATLGPDTLRELREAWQAVDSRPHASAFMDMHDLGDGLIRAGFAGPVLDVEYLTVTYPDVKGVLADLKGLGATNAASGRPRALTGKRAWAAFVQAYESRRTDGRLPATYEVVYGHAWAPEGGARPQDGSTVATSPIRLHRRPR